MTEHHRLGGLHNRDFLTVLETGSPRSRCEKGWLLVRAASFCPHMVSLCTWERVGGGGEREIPRALMSFSFYKDSSLIRLGPHSDDLL